MGVYIIEESSKFPKTVLEDVWVDTVRNLRDNPEFDLETVDKIEFLIKERMINPDNLIDLLVR